VTRDELLYLLGRAAAVGELREGGVITAEEAVRRIVALAGQTSEPGRDALIVCKASTLAAVGVLHCDRPSGHMGGHSGSTPMGGGPLVWSNR
jgi:hypothetical protein